MLEIGLGFRRRLQREVANAKQMNLDLATSSGRPGAPPMNVFSPDSSDLPNVKAEDTAEQADMPAKRAYRHHPKADLNAPERPYSAYVLFSNDVRDKLKDENMSFPDISREVGVRWQALSREEKDRWKQMAAGPWEDYKEKVLTYQQTNQFREYREYVDQFKAEQVSKHDARRPKLQRNRVSSTIYPTPGQTPSAHVMSVSYSSVSSVAFPSAPNIVPSSGDARGQMRPPRSRLASGISAHDFAKPPRTQRVCDVCRRKKSKCDGIRPRCGRCSETESDCTYSDEGRGDVE